MAAFNAKNSDTIEMKDSIGVASHDFPVELIKPLFAQISQIVRVGSFIFVRKSDPGFVILAFDVCIQNTLPICIECLSGFMRSEVRSAFRSDVEIDVEYA